MSRIASSRGNQLDAATASPPVGPSTSPSTSPSASNTEPWNFLARVAADQARRALTDPTKKTPGAVGAELPLAQQLYLASAQFNFTPDQKKTFVYQVENYLQDPSSEGTAYAGLPKIDSGTAYEELGAAAEDVLNAHQLENIANFTANLTDIQQGKYFFGGSGVDPKAAATEAARGVEAAAELDSVQNSVPNAGDYHTLQNTISAWYLEWSHNYSASTGLWPVAPPFGLPQTFYDQLSDNINQGVLSQSAATDLKNTLQSTAPLLANTFNSQTASYIDDSIYQVGGADNLGIWLADLGRKIPYTPNWWLDKWVVQPAIKSLIQVPAPAANLPSYPAPYPDLPNIPVYPPEDDGGDSSTE